MRRILFEIPIGGHTFPIHTFGVLVVFGFLFAMYDARRRGGKVGISKDTITDVSLLALFTGVIGARAFYAFSNLEYLWHSSEPLRSLGRMAAVWQGGLVWHGGLIVAILATIVFCLRRKISPLKMLDVVAPSASLGLAFGRVGCFVNGCCVGGPSTLPWALRFPNDVYSMSNTPVPVGTLLHPTQIYSSIAALAIYGIMAWHFTRRKHNGETAFLFLAVYAAYRFMVEFIRINPQTFTGLTKPQNMCLVLFLLGVVGLLWLRRRKTDSITG